MATQQNRRSKQEVASENIMLAHKAIVEARYYLGAAAQQGAPEVAEMVAELEAARDTLWDVRDNRRAAYGAKCA